MHAVTTELSLNVANKQGWDMSRNKQTEEQPSALVHLDESVSCSVVCDGEPQRILRLGYLHLLGLPADVSEDEVFQSDLTPQ